MVMAQERPSPRRCQGSATKTAKTMTATSFVWNLKKPSHKETTMLGAASAVEVQVGHNSANATAGSKCHWSMYIWRTMQPRLAVNHPSHTKRLTFSIKFHFSLPHSSSHLPV